MDSFIDHCSSLRPGTPELLEPGLNASLRALPRSPGPLPARAGLEPGTSGLSRPHRHRPLRYAGDFPGPQGRRGGGEPEGAPSPAGAESHCRPPPRRAIPGAAHRAPGREAASGGRAIRVATGGAPHEEDLAPLVREVGRWGISGCNGFLGTRRGWSRA